MSLYSNSVVDTSTPTTYSLSGISPNVSQYGWTKTEIGYYNQIVEYVTEVRAAAIYVSQFSDALTGLNEKFNQIQNWYNAINTTSRDFNTKYADFTTKYTNFSSQYSNFQSSYTTFTSKINEFNVDMEDFEIKYSDAAEMYVDVLEKHEDVLKIAQELLQDMAYRGIWNPTTNAWPTYTGTITNSVWDVILPSGTAEHAYGGYTWRDGDRLIYTKTDNKWLQQASGSAVWSVNGKTGAVTLTHSDVNALPLSGGELTGNLRGTTATMTGVVTGSNFVESGRVQSTVDGAVARKDYVDEQIVAAKAETTALVPRIEALEEGVSEELPFPDVWIPFSDGLQMLAGYGDEVKVGGYTVAKMASFSRASTATYIDKSGVLRTAAVNEPRFEKEGLLIEGQSTNVFTTSWGSRTNQSHVTSTQNADGSATHVAFGTASIIAAPSRQLIQPNTTYTASVRFSASKTVLAKYGLRFQFAYTNNWVANTCVCVDTRTMEIKATSGNILNSSIERYGDLVVLTMTTTSPATVETSGGGSVDMYTYDVDSGSIATVTSTAGDTFVEYGFQLETLPFASSYIPTNGAAATRAADYCTFLSYGNTGGEVTVSATIRSMDLETTTSRMVMTFNGANDPTNARWRLYSNNKSMRANWGVGNTAALINVVSSNQSHVVGMRAKQSNLSVFSDGVLTTTTHDCLAPPQRDTFTIGTRNSETLWGHIRNFRIWHRALTDAQLKSIR